MSERPTRMERALELFAKPGTLEDLRKELKKPQWYPSTGALQAMIRDLERRKLIKQVSDDPPTYQAK